MYTFESVTRLTEVDQYFGKSATSCERPVEGVRGALASVTGAEFDWCISEAYDARVPSEIGGNPPYASVFVLPTTSEDNSPHAHALGPSDIRHTKRDPPEGASPGWLRRRAADIGADLDFRIRRWWNSPAQAVELFNPVRMELHRFNDSTALVHLSCSTCFKELIKDRQRWRQEPVHAGGFLFQ